MFSLGIEYLTGYCVATHPAARDQPEWPPHPARVFMAMAAAYFETGADSAEAEALRQLERLAGPPHILASVAEPRTVVTHYVPVNDSLDLKSPTLPFLRVRQPREFPRVRPDHPTVYFCWPDANPPTETIFYLGRVCGKVTRIGHSSSLVRMWVQESSPHAELLHTWQPNADGSDEQLRVFGQGALDELTRRFRADDSAEYDRLAESLHSAKGKAKAQVKEELEARFGGLRAATIRPDFQITAGYRIRETAGQTPPAATIWSRDLIVLALSPLENAHPRLDIVSGPAVARALHKALIRAAQALGPVPEFISGHQADGPPSENPHCAPIPLPFVGRQHADGHLMGVAIAVPATASAAERLLVANAARNINSLTLGQLGKWAVAPATQLPIKHNLSAKTWTGAPAGSLHWASVTPVVFDEHPKSKDIDGYQEEIRRMVSAACVRIGLRPPINIEISHVAFPAGVPTAYQFTRMARKDGSLRRHLHVRITFGQPVIGPVLLGAGRYRGYGLLRPLWEGG